MSAAGKGLVTRWVIAQTALDIIDEGGLEELNMQRVAEQLGIRAPSLYYHFKNKDEILTAVARLILLSTPVLPEPPARQWRSWLLQQCLEFRRTVLRHPKAASLLLGYIPRELFAAQYERTSEILGRAGVPLELHVLIFEAIDKLTLGSAMYSATTADDTIFFPKLDEEQTPTLCSVIEANSWSVEGVFKEALEGFLGSIPDGAAVRASRSKAIGQ